MAKPVANGEIVETIWGPRVRTQVDFSKAKSVTVQSAKKEADINTLVARARASGQWPKATREAVYGDFSDVPDFREAQEHVLRTRDAFGKLPAAVRDACGNDPGVFIKRMRDPEIVELMVRHGLATKREEPASRQPMPSHSLDDAPGGAKPGAAGSGGKVKKGASAPVSGAPSTRSGDGDGHTST